MRPGENFLTQTASKLVIATLGGFIARGTDPGSVSPGREGMQHQILENQDFHRLQASVAAFLHWAQIAAFPISQLHGGNLCWFCFNDSCQLEKAPLFVI